MVYEALLIVAPSKGELPSTLNSEIAKISLEAIRTRGVFTVALSGGSLPGFLASLSDAFGGEHGQDEDPHFESWHVILADERCVPSSDPDSNLGALQKELFSKIPIPASQIYGINEDLLQESSSTEAIAADYQTVVESVLEKSGGQLDLAILGFGPDGHTCSLFPNHALLEETNLKVASIDDSPKPPPKRITLTYPVLNTMTRSVFLCGAGTSKAPVLQDIFTTVSVAVIGCNPELYTTMMKEPYPVPCAGVLPHTGNLVYVVDKDAMEGVVIS